MFRHASSSLCDIRQGIRLKGDGFQEMKTAPMQNVCDAQFDSFLTPGSHVSVGNTGKLAACSRVRKGEENNKRKGRDASMCGIILVILIMMMMMRRRSSLAPFVLGPGKSCLQTKNTFICTSGQFDEMQKVTPHHPILKDPSCKIRSTVGERKKRPVTQVH